MTGADLEAHLAGAVNTSVQAALLPLGLTVTMLFSCCF